MAPASDGKRVVISPTPPIGTQFDARQTRERLRRLVYARDREAELLFEAAERVGLALWYDGALRVSIVKDDRPCLGITEEQAQAMARQISALMRLIWEERIGLSAYCRRTSRMASPPDSELWHEMAPPSWRRPASVEEANARLAEVEARRRQVRRGDGGLA